MNQLKGQTLLFFLASFFVISNVMTSAYNTITIEAGPWLIFTYGSFVFMFGKSALDIVQEFWGRKIRKKITIVAILMNAVIFGITIFGLSVGDYSDGTREFLYQFPRVIVASMVVLLIGQYYADPFVYSLTAKVLKGRSPFIRGLISNMVGSLLLSFPFAYIAFYGDKPTDIVNKIAFGKIALKLPTIFVASAVAAIAIFIIRKAMKMESMIETHGQDHN